MKTLLSAYSQHKATVYCWTPGSRDVTFDTFEEAIGYVRKHIAQLLTFEVFVHNPKRPGTILTDKELAGLAHDLPTAH